MTIYRIKDIKRLGEILSIEPLPPANIVDLEPLKNQIEALKKENKILQSDLEVAQQENVQLKDDLKKEKEKSRELEEKTDQIEALKNKNEKLQSDLKVAQQENDQLENDLNDEKKKNRVLKKKAIRDNWIESVGVISRFCLQLGLWNIRYDKINKNLIEDDLGALDERIPRSIVVQYLKDKKVLQEVYNECCSELGKLNCFEPHGRGKTKRT